VPSCVNAGEVAVRVVVGLEAPPCSLGGGVVLVGVLAGVLVELVCGVVLVAVAAGRGVLATVTVLVPPPQPARSAARVTPSSSVGVLEVLRTRVLIVLMVFATRRAPPRFAVFLDDLISHC
jgi:hypothetical protein